VLIKKKKEKRKTKQTYHASLINLGVLIEVPGPSQEKVIGHVYV
jgi:hypothetical protein